MPACAGRKKIKGKTSPLLPTRLPDKRIIERLVRYYQTNYNAATTSAMTKTNATTTSNSVPPPTHGPTVNTFFQSRQTNSNAPITPKSDASRRQRPLRTRTQRPLQTPAQRPFRRNDNFNAARTHGRPINAFYQSRQTNSNVTITPNFNATRVQRPLQRKDETNATTRKIPTHLTLQSQMQRQPQRKAELQFNDS